jgi:hypothetical protein
MTQGPEANFNCAACGKKFRWKPEIAGRKAKCTCGNVIDVPATLDAPPPDDLYDLAPSDEPPKRKSNPTPAQGVSVQSTAAPVATAQPTAMLGYASNKSKSRFDENYGSGGVTGNPFRDLYLPIALILVGTLVTVLEMMYFSGRKLGFTFAVPYVALYLVINLAILFAACLLAVKIMDMGFGPLGQGILKLSAISIAPAALAAIITYLLHDPFGMVGASISLGLYWGLFYYFFDLDGQEIMILTAIIWLFRTWGSFFIAALLLNMVIGHGTHFKSNSSRSNGGTTTRMVSPGGANQTNDDDDNEDAAPEN